jgi:predicted metal-dependent peptidase
MKNLSWMDKLAKAKALLILDHPFFAALLLPMPMIEDTNCPTMATNGKVIRFNPQFIEDHTLNELIFALAHETMHIVLEHVFRLSGKDHSLWNQATDYCINDLLVNDKVGSISPNWLFNPKLVTDGGGTADGVYKLLKAKPPQPKGKKGQSGTPGSGGQHAMDELEAPSSDPAEVSQVQAETKVRVIQARNAAKIAGKLSAGLERLVSNATRTRTDWRTVLRRFLTERAKNDYSFAKPKRRFLAEDFYLPSLVGEKIGAISIGVDCSGSVDERMLGIMGREIKGILEDVNPPSVDVYYFDSKVLRTESFTPENYADFKLKAVGGGGTAFSPVFKKINKLESPVAVIMLTDLQCSDYGPTPDYPVLWAGIDASQTDIDEVPFGETIYVDSKGEKT